MALWYGLRRGYKAIRAVEEILEGVKSNQSQVVLALSKLDTIEREVKTNGGSSLKDAVNRIDKRVAVLEALEVDHSKQVFLAKTSHHP